MSRYLRLRWVESIGFLCLVLTIIALSITITINFRVLYIFDIKHLNILDAVGLDRATLLKNYDHLMHYLNNPWQQTLAFPDFPMSKSGAFHFQEVKGLFLLCYSVLAITIIPSIFYLYHLVKAKRLWTLIPAWQWAMLLPIVLVILMAAGFDQFFTAFHELFFNNDAWLFDPYTDPIINALPEAYFLHCFLLFFCLLEGCFLVGLLLGKRELKQVMKSDDGA
ncbi:TIGR01906 family membrane protein [Enterococcus faecalis]